MNSYCKTVCLNVRIFAFFKKNLVKVCTHSKHRGSGKARTRLGDFLTVGSVQTYDNGWKILLKLTFDDQSDRIGGVFALDVISGAGVVAAVSPPHALNHQILPAG